MIYPVCRSKPIKIKDGVDIKEVVEKLKGGDSKKLPGRVKNKVINRKIIRKKEQGNAKISV